VCDTPGRIMCTRPNNVHQSFSGIAHLRVDKSPFVPFEFGRFLFFRCDDESEPGLGDPSGGFGERRCWEREAAERGLGGMGVGEEGVKRGEGFFLRDLSFFLRRTGAVTGSMAIIAIRPLTAKELFSGRIFLPDRRLAVVHYTSKSRSLMGYSLGGAGNSSQHTRSSLPSYSAVRLATSQPCVEVSLQG